MFNPILVSSSFVVYLIWICKHTDNLNAKLQCIASDVTVTTHCWVDGTWDIFISMNPDNISDYYTFFNKFIANKYLWNRRNKWTRSSLPFSQSFIPLKVTDVMWWNIGHILSRLLLFHNERHRKPEKHVLKNGYIYIYIGCKLFFS